jgi:hypothetical protein
MSTTPASRFLGAFRLGGFRFARFAFAGFRLAEAFCFFADLRADAFRAMLVSLLATVLELLEHVNQVPRHRVVFSGPRRRLDLLAVGTVRRAQGTD